MYVVILDEEEHLSKTAPDWGTLTRTNIPGKWTVSHLLKQQNSPVQQRRGHTRVIRTQRLLMNFRGSQKKRLGLLSLSLECEQRKDAGFMSWSKNS